MVKGFSRPFPTIFILKNCINKIYLILVNSKIHFDVTKVKNKVAGNKQGDSCCAGREREPAHRGRPIWYAWIFFEYPLFLLIYSISRYNQMYIC